MNMKKIFPSIILFFVLGISSCNKDVDITMADGIDIYENANNITLTKSQRDMTTSTNAFAFNLFNQVREDRSDKSILLSPFSASLALGMTASGAEGETERQMRSVLGFEEVTKEEMSEYYSAMLSGLAKADPYVDFKIANSIWVHNTFPVKGSYLQKVMDKYGSTVENRDFDSPTTLKEINEWVSNKTDGTIKDFLDHLSSSTKMALINALSFEGKWRFAFPGAEKGVFNNINGRKSRIEMMFATGILNYGEKDGWELLGLPYGTGAFSMYLVMPPSGSDFKSTHFDKSRWDELLGASDGRSVNMHIPSFIADDFQDLIDPLKSMGMTDAFSRADFSGISDTPVAIGKIDQKTHLEIDKNGTKATAATEVQMMAWLPGPSDGTERQDVKIESVNFDADRPFYFIIRESSTNAILFIGQITDL